MADLPSNMSYGTVIGQFVTSVIDSGDAGRDPDMVPCSGTVSFHPNSTRVINTGAIPNPLTIFNKDITTSLDASGYIVGPDGVRGVKLVASDDPDTSPTMFSYTVTVALNGVSPLSFSFMLPGGTTIDLTTVAPVPADIAGEVTAWVQAVEQTRLNVVAAQAAQVAAEAAKNAAISAGVPTPTTAGHVLTAITNSTYGWAAAPAGTGSDPLKANVASPTFTGTVGGITASMVGLGSVDNTTDASKPVSTAAAAALAAKAPLASPTFTGTVGGLTKAMVGLANVDNTTDAAKPISTSAATALSAKAPLASPTFTGVVGGLTSTMVGLGSVNNTSDAAKPVSTATQAALDAKAALAAGVPGPTTAGTVLTALTATTFGWAAATGGSGGTSDPLKANLDSPTFTGIVGGITKSMVGLASVDNTTDAAKPVSTAQASALAFKANLASPTFTGTVGGLSSSMVGLGAVNNTADADKPVSTATASALALKASLASPTFTGTVSGVTAAMVGLGLVSNTADADKPVSTAASSALALKAPLASPTFTGTVSGISRAMIQLGSVNNTSDVDKPISTATQNALNGKVNVGSTSSSLNSVKTPTVWVTGAVYGVGDYFSTSFGVIYRVTVAHTAAATEPTAATADFTVWGSSGNFPGSVIVRNALGEVAFSAAYATDVPTAASELTNKQYVDTQVATVAAPAIPFVFYPIVWNGSAWTYGNVVITARPSGMRSGDIAFFDGVGTLPTWATTNDLMTEG